MGKYKRLKTAHEDLKLDFEHLVRTLKADGSLDPHCGTCDQFIEGQHSFRITCAQVDANTALFKVKELAKHLGLKFEHIEVDKWEYKERTDTDNE